MHRVRWMECQRWVRRDRWNRIDMGSHKPRDEVEAIVGVAEEAVGEETTRRTVVEVVVGGEGPILEVEAEDTFRR